MAGTRVTSGTTTSNVVTTVPFTTWYSEVEVVNRGAAELWVRTDGITPTVAGDDCDVVPASTSSILPNRAPGPEPGEGRTAATSVKVISTGAVAYTVAGL